MPNRLIFKGIGLKGFEFIVYFLFVSFGLLLILGWAYDFCFIT